MVKAFQQVESDFEHLCRQHSRIVERSDAWVRSFAPSLPFVLLFLLLLVFFLLLLLLLLLESEVQESVPSVLEFFDSGMFKGRRLENLHSGHNHPVSKAFVKSPLQGR